MSWEITTYLILSLLTAAISLLAAGIAWHRRPKPGATSFSLLLLCGGIWSLSEVFDMLAVGIPNKIFWAKLEYIGAATVGSLFLVFALEYAHLKHWLTRRNLVLLSIVPVGILTLVVTNEWHHLIWDSFTFDNRNANGVLIYGHAGGFWLNVVYNYALFIASAVVLVHFVMQSRQEMYRLQIAGLLIGSLAPAASVAIYALGWTPLPGLDVSALPFAVTGIAFTLSAFRYGLLDLAPIARDRLIENLSDGVLVLDAQNRIVDINPAGRQMIGAAASPIGHVLGEIFLPWQEALRRHPVEQSLELKVASPATRFLEARLMPLGERREGTAGWLITLRDITERKRADDELHLANEHLAQQLLENEALQANLREQAIRDSLTGLFNRRYLEETLGREMARALREGYPIGIVMMDIDHFKSTNDRWGHPAGDRILQALGELLRSESRADDIACRFGGEEFVVVMPSASVEAARQRAEHWRQAAEDLRVHFNGSSLQITLSIGVAAFPANGASTEAVLHAADRALYASKAAGRNRVSVWDGITQ